MWIKYFWLPGIIVWFMLGTGKRSCLDNYPLSKMCSGKSFYSSVSIIKKPNFYTTSKLSDDHKFFICKTAEK